VAACLLAFNKVWWAKVSDNPESNGSREKASILHVCTRDVLRPIRDQILRVAGYNVESSETHEEALDKFQGHPYDLVLVDIDTQHHVHAAEELCQQVKTAHPKQRVAFVCNWRVAILNNCPDEIVRSEFDPVAFLTGVAGALAEDGHA
jgi:CheY-like chemotaxis protein